LPASRMACKTCSFMTFTLFLWLVLQSYAIFSEKTKFGGMNLGRTSNIESIVYNQPAIRTTRKRFFPLC